MYASGVLTKHEISLLEVLSKKRSFILYEFKLNILSRQKCDYVTYSKVSN